MTRSTKSTIVLAKVLVGWWAPQVTFTQRDSQDLIRQYPTPMSDYIIKVENLGKKYSIQHQEERQRYVALRDVIAGWVKGLGSSVLSAIRSWVPGFGSSAGNRYQPTNSTLSQHPKPNTQSSRALIEEFWALREVSFEVKPGDVVGIIGRNGAGKSTLLKILSRITQPTEGRVRIRGRAASLLEVGMGFHPELTGRENIFVNGAILGMRRVEIARKFDEIVAFAEVEKFLDTPVKRYSSGMYVRLAFAVAAHLEPEILIVDEVLAVGDAQFQKKCLGKMHEASRGGRTVLFVSHNLAAVQALCSRAIWLDRGVVSYEGSVDECISRYLAQSLNEVGVPPGQVIRIGPSLELRHFDVSPNPVESGGRVEFSMSIAANAPTKMVHLTLLIYSSQEMRVAIVDLRSSDFPVFIGAGEVWTLRGWIKSVPLVEGDYRIGLGMSTADFFGDQLGLIDLRVAARSHKGSHAPYPAVHRGLVELEFGVEP